MTIRNNAFDFLRLVAAFFVVLAHTGYPFAFGRFAVPFFFMLSGFYYNQMDEKRKIQYVDKLFWLTIFSTFIYSLWLNFDSFVLNDLPWNSNLFVKLLILNLIILLFVRIVGLISWISVAALFLLNVITPNTHLWYLYAALWVFVFLFKLDKSTKKSFKYLKFAPLLLLPCCLLAFGGKVMVYRNFLFEGLPYITIGIMLQKSNCNYFSLKKLIIGLVLAIVLLNLEVYIYQSLDLVVNRDHYILTLPLTLLMFVIALSLKWKDNFFSNLGRKFSSGIYIWHMIFVFLLQKFACLENNCFLGIIVFILSLLFSAIIGNKSTFSK